MIQFKTDAKLLPCVQCGHMPHVFHVAPIGPWGWHFELYCDNCLDDGTTAAMGDTFLSALQDWDQWNVEQ